MTKIIVPASWRQIVEYRDNGALQSGSSAKQIYTTDFIDSTSNPTYRDQIARQEDAGSPFSKRTTTKVVSSKSSGILTHSGYAGHVLTSNLSVMPTNWSPKDFSAVDNSETVISKDIALKHLKSKLATKSGNYEALVPLAEVKELHTTYRSMVDLTTQLCNTIIDFRGKIKNKKKALRELKKFASSAWLTYSFGVAPSMGDFQSLLENIQLRYFNNGGRTVREVGGSQVRFKENLPDWAVYTAGFTPYRGAIVYRGSFYYHVKHFLTAGRFLDWSSANGYSIRDQFGLDIKSVVPAAEELIPFSWLLNYFTTSSDYISDVFESPAGNSIYTYQTTVSEYALRASGTFVPYADSAVRSTNSIPTTPLWNGYDMKRIRLSSLPHRSLRIKTLDEIGVNSLARLANLLSLVGGK